MNEPEHPQPVHWFESNPTWFKTAVFYEIHTRAFFDGNKAFIRRSMNELERRLPGKMFFRANRQYIEEEIPHIANLMCDSPAAMVEHAQVIVIGCDGPEARKVLEGLRPDQKVIDLTRTTFKDEDKARTKAAA